MFTAKLTGNRLFAVICLTLALGTLAVYWPVTHHDFVDFDDGSYITANPHVMSGLTCTNVAWAFTSTEAANWHPLTWISHMADCQLYGLNPGGPHLTNVLFHIANTLLLFLLLQKMTGALWRSAFVAALFAWHPLHVESVAWAAERKDVLSTFFWMLALLAYARFVNLSKVRNPKSKIFYILTLGLFACGLMSKAMVVTLPFVLLLLDFWPLGRFPLAAENIFRRATVLAVEKIPFFILAAAGSAATFFVQKSNGAFSPVSDFLRLENVLTAYARYLSKTFWPANLAIIYPYHYGWPMLLVAGVALLLVLWTALIIFAAKKYPYLPVGWFWFLGTLVPVIGIVQVGAQSMADRYMYIPGIGIFIMVVWGANDLPRKWPKWKTILLPIGGAVLIALLMVTSVQLTYWQNSLKLFSHAVAVTTNNYVAYVCLGNVLEKEGRKDDAFFLYSESVRIEPDYPLGQSNLGLMLLEKGRPDEAFIHLQRAAQLAPHDPDMQYDLGVFLSQHGQPAAAIHCFNRALGDRPDFPQARSQLNQILARDGKHHEPLDTAK